MIFKNAILFQNDTHELVLYMYNIFLDSNQEWSWASGGSINNGQWHKILGREKDDMTKA